MAPALAATALSLGFVGVDIQADVRECDIGAKESGQIVQDVLEITASCRVPGSFGGA
jgi:hypothetical protein